MLYQSLRVAKQKKIQASGMVKDEAEISKVYSVQKLGRIP